MQLRRSHRPERLGDLNRRSAGPRRLVTLGLLALAAVSCASHQPPERFYTVKAGDNLYRIGKRFGVSTEALVRTNGIRDVHAVSVGTLLRIPSGGKGAPPARLHPGPSTADLRARARAEARAEAQLDFAWPVRGELTSGFGTRHGRPHEGIDLAAARGVPIRAAEAGKVIHSGRLGDYGRVVILKHAGNYRTVYAHTQKTYVKTGEFVEKGEKIATVGSSGRATGPHLHFEIRTRDVARDPLHFLR